MIQQIGDFINKHLYEYKTYKRFIVDIQQYGLELNVDNKIPLEPLFGACANGCGEKGGTKFPSFFFSLLRFACIYTACSIHDIEWELADNYQELLDANDNFDNNLKKICDQTAKYEFEKWIYRRFISYYIDGVEVKGTNNYAKERGFI